jgi:HAD superfamily hydrolase (TIGR01662 family)
MGRYSAYIDVITQFKQNKKSIGMSVFNVLIDNSKPFTPGDQLEIYPFVQDAIQLLTQKGYDLLFITGQPPRRTRDIAIEDFDNILDSLKNITSEYGGTAKASYYTPSSDKTDPYVKPNIGMFRRAENENNVVWKDTFFIGCDKNDIKAALSLPTTAILVGDTKDSVNNDSVQKFENLLEFAKAV